MKHPSTNGKPNKQAEIAKQIVQDYDYDKWKTKQAEIAKLGGVSNQDNDFEPMWYQLNLEKEPMSTCLSSPATQEYTEQVP